MTYVNQTIESMAVTWRNRNLDKPLTQQQVEYFSKLAVQTPSKQSNKYFDVYCITNLELIEKIYLQSAVPDPGYDGQPYNPQVLSPLLLLWMECDLQTGELSKNYLANSVIEDVDDLTVDTHQAVGISAGVVCYEANRLGFQTGFCRCIDSKGVCKELKSFGFDVNDQTLLLSLSIGYGRDSNPRQHQKLDMVMQPHDRIEPGLFYIN